MSLVLPVTEVIDDAPGLAVAGLKCLVVDDNELNRDIFRRQLEPWGISITTVETAATALLALIMAANAGAPFDVVISDHRMPGTSGLELGSLIRATPRIDGTRLILATSGLMEPAKDFDEVFTKPIRVSALLAALQPRKASARPGESMPAMQPSEAPARRMRILVADDNAINQKVAAGYLAKAGHRVDVASTGVEAVSAVRALPYDIVFMDVQMPEMDGLAATRAIRRLGGDRAKVRVVGMTANVLPRDRDACFAAGMNAYLAKPLDRTQLLDIVRMAERHDRPSSSIEAARQQSQPPLYLSPDVLGQLVGQLGREAVEDLLAEARKRVLSD